MPNKARGKKAAAKADKRAKKALEKAKRDEALAKLEALVLKFEEEREKTDLYAEPPPKEECPICMLPYSWNSLHQVYASCCGNQICRSCLYFADKNPKSTLAHNCAFCRESRLVSRLKKRMQLDDPRAFHQAYTETALCSDVTLSEHNRSAPKSSEILGLLYICRAAELGHARSILDLSVMFSAGNDLIESNEERERLFLDIAARRGDMHARHVLGHKNWLSGLGKGWFPDPARQRESAMYYKIAAKHFAISASYGHKGSMERLIKMNAQGDLSTEDLTKTVSAYRQCVKEEWSEEREEADKYYDMVEKLRKMQH